ncbi:UDP-glucose 4-epimerase [Cymbomonas tetramitiformis]|uniref:UDP-glucose 4-epimerase n=1 Tax=Cymbomonas tetramitiformis TaxID=36881 RepID=A0AAE0C6U5_9CHLO|nr:UDP-glucose 4-epimerase [Cymbomonas tetramitiformis]
MGVACSVGKQIGRSIPMETEDEQILAGVCVLVTGGAGYIGSHTCLRLLERGCDVVSVDNLCNSSEEAMHRVRKLAKDKGSRLSFYKVDLLDFAALEEIFVKHRFDAVIHFAGLKAVGESVQQPLKYYHNNLTSTMHLIQTMEKHDCKKLVFSSSATVYGQPETVPADEDATLGATNPYGRTKLFIEEIFRDVSASDESWRIVLLRYFNPVGAHPSGMIGEDPVGIPNNLMPFIQQVAVGRRKELTVFGNDYATPDGTGVRDYIHVMDLADGHVAAVSKCRTSKDLGCLAVNLGTGKGSSVLELLRAYEVAAKKKIPYKIARRRPGDNAEVYAKTDLAESDLNWRASRTIEDACADSWKWISHNPDGYRSVTVEDLS